MSGPLAHIRVLDLSRIMAGPWASQLLADLGADVIKVERTLVGDDTRAWGPPFLKHAAGEESRESGYYLSVNRGKRSITLDLDTAAGQHVVKELARRSDIILENFKVGTLRRFGLDYESLRAVNPAVVYCSITGFGQTGPWRDHAAYDFMIQAMGGLMSVTGEADGKPGAGPQKVGVPVTDIMTGMYATVAMLAALARRNETGRGDYIDISMLDVQVGFLANQAMNYLISGRPPRRTGNAHPNIQPQDVFTCRDGHMALAVGNDSQFDKFCIAVARPDWATDARFTSNAERVRNREALYALIAELLAQNDVAHWVARIEAAGVPCAPINTIPMVLEEPQVRHREMLRQIPHPLGVHVPQIANPIRYAEASLSYERAPPLLGQHTEEILRELGIAAEDVGTTVRKP